MEKLSESFLGNKQRWCLGFRSGSACILLGVALMLSGLCLAQAVEEGRGRCDIYDGSWVVDESYPIYNSALCPNARRAFACERYGRPDNLYLKYRWQPKACDLPRFDGKDLLTRYKGKKIMFVGDSLTLNHWQSMVCLLHAAVPNPSRFSQTNNGSTTTFLLQDYDLSVIFHHSPYLVDVVAEKVGRVLKLHSLSDGKMWKTIDVLIFNTWLWWYRTGSKQPWDYIQDGEDHAPQKEMNRMIAFEKAMDTWGKWVDSEVDFNKTQVFFRAFSASHYHGMDWNEPMANDCSNETTPVSGSTYPAGLPKANHEIERVLSGVKKPVHYLNITTLTQLRKDGHPSKYGGMRRSMDCTHWCIAGVPDIWNHLIYATLVGP